MKLEWLSGDVCARRENLARPTSEQASGDHTAAGWGLVAVEAGEEEFGGGAADQGGLCLLSF
ncbi:hypothetical protein, partial [Nocardia alni]|uniref:hypothetical protein n=1 Tax=Nocardia alni TaxID=2815723 RepID=UPI0020B2B682